MSKMSEVYMRYLEEKKYDKNLTEESYLSKVAYSKGYQPKDKPKTEDKK